MIYGPNTSDTRANPSLAMLVADIASWSQHFFRQNLDRASSFRHAKSKSWLKKGNHMVPWFYVLIHDWPLLCSLLQKCAPQNPIIISCQYVVKMKMST